MNNQLKDDHYVYVLKDKNGIIRYVGEGRQKRLNDLSGRTTEFLSIYKDGGSTYKIAENLTKNEAIIMESEYLVKYLNNSTSEVNLINKIKGRKNRDIFYEDMTKIFRLDEKTGNLIRIYVDQDHPHYLNTVAGSTNKRGYVSVSVGGTNYRAHRIVWVLYNKTDLTGDILINHIDGNPSNNHHTNLELVSALENCHKKVNYKLTKSGVLGINIKPYKGIPDRLVVASCPTYDNKGISKCFSISKYGYDEALRLGIEWRESKLKELYPEIYNKGNKN